MVSKSKIPSNYPYPTGIKKCRTLIIDSQMVSETDDTSPTLVWTNKNKHWEIWVYKPIRGDCFPVSKESAMPFNSTCHVARVGGHKNITFNSNNVVKSCHLWGVIYEWFHFFFRCKSLLQGKPPYVSKAIKDRRYKTICLHNITKTAVDLSTTKGTSSFNTHMGKICCLPYSWHEGSGSGGQPFFAGRHRSLLRQYIFEWSQDILDLSKKFQLLLE